jgi:hypothetical protein
MEETFKIIKDFENYSVSNLGNIINNKTNRILKPSIDAYGYYIVSLRSDKNTYTKKIHKLIAEYFIANPYNKSCVDHINNNKLDNNVNNLRWATIQENNMNSKLRSDNASKYKGVSFDKQRNKYMACISINGKNKYLGRFDNIEEAVNARVKKSKELFGEYMNHCEKEITINLNIPVNTKVNLNINVKSKEDQELEDLEKELNEIINSK